ncbi:MAG: hypothetical protein ACOCP1_02625 [Campylobacterales bacterium]
MGYTKNSFLRYFGVLFVLIVLLILNALNSVTTIGDKSTFEDKKAIVVARNVELTRSNKNMVIYQGSAQKIIKEGSKDTVYGMSLEKRDEQKVEFLNSPKAVNLNGKFIFEDGVSYSDSKGVKFFSQKGEYLQKDEVLIGSGEFTLDSEELEVKGEDIYYNAKTSEIEAKNIEATIYRSVL